MADISSTFEHGNLIRGVCPIAEFSQTLIQEIGKASSAFFYLTHPVLSAVEARQLALTQEVSDGIRCAQQRALQVAATRPPASIMGRALADADILVSEAAGARACLSELIPV